MRIKNLFLVGLPGLGIFIFAIFFLLRDTGKELIIPIDLEKEPFIFLSGDCLIDFRRRPPRIENGIRMNRTDVFLESGWYSREKWGTWAGPDQSILKMVLLHSRYRYLLLECKSYPGLPLQLDQYMDVYANEKLCRRLKIKREMSRYLIPIPEGSLIQGINVLRFRYASSHPDKKKLRDLAVGFRRLRLKETASSRFDDSAGISTDRDRSQIRIHRTGTLLLSIKTSRQRGNIRLGCRFQTDLSPLRSLGRCRSTLLKFGENFQRMVPCGPTVSFDAGSPGSVIDIPFSGVPDWYCLRFDVVLSDSPVIFEISDPAIVLHPPTEEGGTDIEKKHVSMRDRKSGWPDIIMIVLDAARADHFGYPYGYIRDTIPEITRNLSGSLFFKNAMAQAPYTVCSVPTMITGLSFTIHRVTELDDRLSPQETTLAEYLADFNYHCLCYSATVNHSKRLGFDQGYAEFFQAWKQGVSYETSIDPFFLTQKVVERIQEGFLQKPVFLMLHYVPPHSPYHPSSEFNRFTDPGYDGPCDGSVDYISSLRKENTVPDKADIEALAALYDGNLLMVDHAIGRLLNQLKQSGMWERSLIIITSDHGEAFFEHGKPEHNSTLYQEMIHVPLVFKLPSGMSHEGINTDQLVSLEDLVPTILGILKRVPDSRVSGIDLIKSSGDGSNSSRRLIMRTVSARGYYGLRIGDWKLIHHRSGSRIELYNLKEDPGEKNNRLLDDPVFSAHFCLILEDELQPRPGVSPARKQKVLDKDTEEMLKTLGYTD